MFRLWQCFCLYFLYFVSVYCLLFIFWFVISVDYLLFWVYYLLFEFMQFEWETCLPNWHSERQPTKLLFKNVQQYLFQDLCSQILNCICFQNNVQLYFFLDKENLVCGRNLGAALCQKFPCSTLVLFAASIQLPNKSPWFYVLTQYGIFGTASSACKTVIIVKTAKKKQVIHLFSSILIDPSLDRNIDQ